MGIADAFGRDDRIEIKVSDYVALQKAAIKGEFMLNGIIARIPHETILSLITGKSDLLQKYVDTGLTPDQLMEMDEIFLQKCMEVTELEAENEQKEKLLDELRNMLYEE